MLVAIPSQQACPGIQQGSVPAREHSGRAVQLEPGFCGGQKGMHDLVQATFWVEEGVNALNVAFRLNLLCIMGSMR